MNEFTVKQSKSNTSNQNNMVDSLVDYALLAFAKEMTPNDRTARCRVETPLTVFHLREDFPASCHRASARAQPKRFIVSRLHAFVAATHFFPGFAIWRASPTKEHQMRHVRECGMGTSRRSFGKFSPCVRRPTPTSPAADERSVEVWYHTIPYHSVVVCMEPP